MSGHARPVTTAMIIKLAPEIYLTGLPFPLEANELPVVSWTRVVFIILRIAATAAQGH